METNSWFWNFYGMTSPDYKPKLLWQKDQCISQNLKEKKCLVTKHFPHFSFFCEASRNHRHSENALQIFSKNLGNQIVLYFKYCMTVHILAYSSFWFLLALTYKRLSAWLWKNLERKSVKKKIGFTRFRELSHLKRLWTPPAFPRQMWIRAQGWSRNSGLISI